MTSITSKEREIEHLRADLSLSEYDTQQNMVAFAASILSFKRHQRSVLAVGVNTNSDKVIALEVELSETNMTLKATRIHGWRDVEGCEW